MKRILVQETQAKLDFFISIKMLKKVHRLMMSMREDFNQIQGTRALYVYPTIGRYTDYLNTTDQKMN